MCIRDRKQQKELALAQWFLEHFEEEGDGLFENIVTGDESWIFTKASRQNNSVQWWYSWPPQAKKFKQLCFDSKIMTSVFFLNKKWGLLIDFMKCGITINADTYCEILWKLIWVIQNKRRGFYPTGLCFSTITLDHMQRIKLFNCCLLYTSRCV